MIEIDTRGSAFVRPWRSTDWTEDHLDLFVWRHTSRKGEPADTGLWLNFHYIQRQRRITQDTQPNTIYISTIIMYKTSLGFFLLVLSSNLLVNSFPLGTSKSYAPTRNGSQFINASSLSSFSRSFTRSHFRAFVCVRVASSIEKSGKNLRRIPLTATIRVVTIHFQ